MKPRCGPRSSPSCWESRSFDWPKPKRRERSVGRERKPSHRLLLGAALLFFAANATAEVSDKIPPRTLVLAWPFACLVVTALAWSSHRSLGVLTTLLATVPTFALLSELADPFVGPAISKEQGLAYVAAAWASVAAIMVGGIYGVQRRGRRMSGDRS
jgi:hypothetical protein